MSKDTELEDLNSKRSMSNDLHYDMSLKCIKKRHILTVYAFFGFLIAYALRVNLSVAIVDMVREPTAHLNGTNKSVVNAEDGVKYEWSPALQGYILASFFYGYIVTQLPAGKL